MKKLSVPCDFEGRPGSFQVWVGCPAPGFQPLHFQTAWLREERGGEISEEVVERLERGPKRSRIDPDASPVLV